MTEGDRSAGVAYIDLAIGKADELMAGVKLMGQQAAETLQRALALDAPTAPKVFDENEAARQGEAAGKSASEALRTSVVAGVKETTKEAAGFWDDFGKGFAYQVGAWGLGYSISQGIIGAFHAAEGAVIGFNSQLQQAQISFTTLLGNSGVASQFIDQLKQFATVTPFNFSGLVSDAQRMLAMQIPLNSILTDLTAIGDVTSAMGGSNADLESLVNIFSEMAAKGQVMEVQLRQLEIRGVNAAVILANSYGVTTAEFQKMVTKGEILANEAIPKLVQGIENGTDGINGHTQAMAGEMALQADTMMGAWSNVQDFLTQFAANAFVPIFHAVNEGTTSLEKFLSTDKVKAFGDEISRQLSVAGQDIEQFGREADAVFGPIWNNGLKQTVGGLADLEQHFGLAGIGATALGVIVARQLGPSLNDLTGASKAGAAAYEDITTAMGRTMIMGGNLYETIRSSVEAYGPLQTAVGGVKASMETGAVTGNAFTNSLKSVALTGAATAEKGLTSLVNFLGGPWGVAITMATIGITLITQDLANQKAKADEVTASINEAGKSYAEFIKSNPKATQDDLTQWVSQQSQGFKDLASDVSKAGINMNGFLGAMSGNKDSLASFNNVMDSLITKYQTLTPGEQNATGFNSQALVDLKKKVDDAAGSMVSNTEIAKLLTKSLGDVGATALMAGSQTSPLADALAAINDKSNDAATNLSALKKAMDALKSASMDVDTATITWTGDLASFKDAMGKAKDSIHGTSTASVSLQNQFVKTADSAYALYQANLNAGMSADQAKKQFDDQIAALEKAAGGFANLPPVVQDYITKLEQIPPVVTTTAKLDTDAASSAIDNLLAKLYSLPGIAQKEGALAGAYAQQGATAGTGNYAYQHSAAGGLIRGPGSSTSDSIPTMLSDGEFVVKADAVSRYGAGFLSAINSMSLPSGLTAGYSASVPYVAMSAPAGSAAMSGPVGMPSLAGTRVVVQIGAQEFEGYVAAISDANSDRRDADLAYRLTGQ